MQSMLGAFPNMIDAQEMYNTGKKARGGYLAGLAYNSQGADRQNALAKLAGIDPNAAIGLGGKLQEQDYGDLIESAKILNSVRGTPMEGQAYQALKPRVAKYGLNLPEMPDESVWGAVDQIVGALGDSTQDNVQSTFIDPQGNLNYLSRGGRTVNTGKQVSDKYTPIINPVNGLVSGYSGRGNVLAPTGVGNQANMPPPDYTTSGDYIIPNDPRVLPQFNDAMGRELAQAQTYAKQRMDAGLWTGEQAAQFVETVASDLQRKPAQSQPTQARIGVKPDAPKTAIAYDADGNAFVADVSTPGAIPGAVRPGSQLSAKDKQKIETMKRKEYNLVNSNASKINETVRIIDDIVKSNALGGVTGIGAIASNIPGTKWADTAAKLETLRAKSAFGALSEMRANSPTGGALGSVTERELSLLQNAETQLSQAQSPEAFKQALLEYKRILLESQKRMVDGVQGFYGSSPQAPSAPQAPASNREYLLDKY
jgi:hypothetical protein